MDKKELVEMIARRDGITFNEAYAAVEDCANEIAALFELDHEYSAAELYEEAVDILRSELSIEPDFLDVVLDT